VTLLTPINTRKRKRGPGWNPARICNITKSRWHDLTTLRRRIKIWVLRDQKQVTQVVKEDRVATIKM